MLTVTERGEGSPVVLIHGLPGSAGAWRPVTERLTGHRILVPDLVGFGATGGAPPTPALLADAQAEQLAATLDHLGVRSATLVGHDFGGPVALRLLDRRPDLVGGLALLATNVFPDTPIPFPLVAVTWPGIGRAASRLLFSSMSLRFMTARMTGHPRLDLDRRIYVGDADQARAIRLIFTDALTNLAQRYAPVEAIVRRTAVPATVVWGSRDPFFPVTQAERTAAALPEADLHILPGAGHALPEERPDEVAAAIRALAARVQVAG
jgi:pimeloyl-ACP methyl ester carboxylesterase